MGVSENLRQLRESVPSGVELVAVSKFHPVEALLEAYETGQRVFGESRANELCDKAKVMPADVRWHFIGHLQTTRCARYFLMCRLSTVSTQPVCCR